MATNTYSPNPQLLNVIISVFVSVAAASQQKEGRLELQQQCSIQKNRHAKISSKGIETETAGTETAKYRWFATATCFDLVEDTSYVNTHSLADCAICPICSHINTLMYFINNHVHNKNHSAALKKK